MALTEEQRRALAYRQQQAQRCAAEQARSDRLRGNPARRAELAEDWQPLIDASDDARSGSDETECDA